MMSKQIHILLVEDNEADAVLVREALRDAKIHNTLHIASDGQAALDFLRSESGLNPDHVRPGLILLDLNMPRKNGQETLHEIKTDPGLKTIPVVIMTSSHEETEITKAYESQANSYIVKPVDFNQLIKVVETIENFWLTIVELPK